MELQWKPIKGYEGLYEISNTGLIRTNKKYCIKRNSKEKINKYKYIKGSPDSNGYIVLTLYKTLGNKKDKKTHKLHKLVAEHFLINEHNYHQINHKDENKSNNNVNNLEWCDSKYNNNYGTRTKRVSDKLSKKVCQYDLDGNLIKQWRSLNELKKYGYNICKISEVCNHKKSRKTSQGYKWEYLDNL